jgi:glutamate/tyrosine decarboxylase-like PLP-dependent enzyme
MAHMAQMNDDFALLARAAGHARDYLQHIRDRPVAASLSSEQIRSLLGGPLPRHGDDACVLLDRLAETAQAGTAATQGPRYFGFVVGGSLPVATAADWLVSAWDQNAGVFVMSPIVAVIEDIVAGWLREIVGLPGTTSVGFVTGCQMANFTALAAARHHVLAGLGYDVEAHGLAGAPPIDIVVGDESHYTIFMALRLAGLGAATARRVATDDQGRMRVDELERTLQERRDRPCIICAQAGNVNTGAFDPIDAIADLARDRGAWLHVDGAFGLWAAASPALAPLVKGIARADSIATDGHKWLNVPYDSGIVFCAHPGSHRAAMTLAASYIQETQVERDPHEFVPEESRRARAVPLYAALRVLGQEGLRELVERCCRLARRMGDRLNGDPGVRVLNDVVLNQVLVRFESDDFTRKVIARVQQDGTCWLGGTTWQGNVAMRISIANWSTTEADVDRSAAAILSAAQAAA